MNHSKNFEKVKYYYETRRWDEYRVSEAVKKGWITAEEYEEITGQPYEE
mgnify:CR=1 FL=1